MTNIQKLLNSAVVLIAIAGAGCGVQTQQEASATAKMYTPKIEAPAYVKPGASVTMSHNFKGFVKPGSSGSVQVTFTPSVDAGKMRVEASTKGGLALAPGSMQKTFSLEQTGDHMMDIGFSAQAPGPQYINFQVYTTDAAGQTLGRAFTLPIQVGDPELNPPSKPAVNIETTTSGQRIVVMDAQETISAPE